MNILKLAVFCFFQFTLAPVFAANTGGMDSGGGHGIICFTEVADANLVRDRLGYVPDRLLEKVRSLEFLDYYFAQRPIGIERLTVELVDETKFDSGANLYYFLKNRLKEPLPNLFEILESSEARFDKTGITWAPIADNPIFDTGLFNVITDDNCVLILMAYQEKMTRAHYLQIDQRLYNHPLHSKLSQASLFLHEFLYLHARENGAVESNEVITLVRLLIRNELDVKKINAVSTKLRL